MMNYYTCGTLRNVRGNCGHKHRTIDSAEKCCQRDQAGCKSQGGYSDRSIQKFAGGEEIEIEIEEREWLYRTRE